MSAPSDRAAWLAALQPGDEVAADTSFSMGLPRRGRVARRTPSGRIIVRLGNLDCTFLPNGWQYGATSRPWHLEPVTPELLAREERARLAGRLGCVEWRSLSLVALREVAAVVEREEAP